MTLGIVKGGAMTIQPPKSPTPSTGFGSPTIKIEIPSVYRPKGER